MKITETAIADVLILEPGIFCDARGFFSETFNQRDFNAATGTNFKFVQDNHSRSKKSVLRGLHYQVGQPQGKLVRVVRGSIFDVVVDIRQTSATFGQWVGLEMNEHDLRQLWVPPGFAHGFLVLSDSADCYYKTTDYYCPAQEHCIAWNDSQIGIDWRLDGPPLLSVRDARGLSLRDAQLIA
ncbi:MAG: dTDP-4-dehydrorhamnose 3,5-epimerase [Glaciimonas sp.]|nr:dTDP-4-dehydrorhamnose 3,5-epimerase [Glaciimonas sp.]